MAVDKRGGSGEAAGSAQDRVVGGPGWPGKVQAAGCKERCPRGLEPAGGCSPERTHRPRGSRCWVAEGEDGSLCPRAVAVTVVGRRCRRRAGAETVRSGVVADLRNRGGRRHNQGSSLWTELCLVPTAARWTAQHLHPRNCLRHRQDWGPRSPSPRAHRRRARPPGWRCGLRRAMKGASSLIPTPPA